MPLALPSQRLQYSGRSNQSRTNLPAQQRICLDWNDDPNPDCPYPHCKFEHICYRCAVNPRIGDNRHKAMLCLNRGKGLSVHICLASQGANFKLYSILLLRIYFIVSRPNFTQALTFIITINNHESHLLHLSAKHAHSLYSHLITTTDSDNKLIN